MRARAPRRRNSWSSGAVAVEFAIVAPILITLLLSLCDIAPLITVKYKTSNATQSVSDLTNQFANLRATDVADLFSGGGDIMAPFSSSGLLLRITSVASDGKGNAFVHWSCGQGALAPYTAKSTVATTPSGGAISSLLYLYSLPLLGGFTGSGTNTTLIMVESQYNYSTPAQYIVKSTQKLVAAAYGLPRVSAYIGFPWDGNPNDQPTAPASATKTASVTLSNGAVCNYVY